MPDTPEYLARISQISGSSDPLTAQKETPRILAELIANVSAEKLTMRPEKDKWSVAEILAHLAEDEIATGWRYRQMVEHNGIDLAGFNQDMWARMGDYASRLPSESLELFRLLRNSNLQFLQRLSPEQWQCSGNHAERGSITVEGLAGHMAGHDLNHLEQIRKILA